MNIITIVFKVGLIDFSTLFYELYEKTDIITLVSVYILRYPGDMIDMITLIMSPGYHRVYTLTSVNIW